MMRTLQATPSKDHAGDFVRAVWVALMTLAICTIIGLAAAELMATLFAESWNISGAIR